MASKIGMARRNEAAQARIDAALESIVADAGLALPERPARSRDAVWDETQRLEWQADLLETVRRALVQDEPDLASLKRAELDAYAEAHGVTDPGALPNKDAVLAAIAAAEVPA